MDFTASDKIGAAMGSSPSRLDLSWAHADISVSSSVVDKLGEIPPSMAPLISNRSATRSLSSYPPVWSVARGGPGRDVSPISTQEVRTSRDTDTKMRHLQCGHLTKEALEHLMNASCVKINGQLKSTARPIPCGPETKDLSRHNLNTFVKMLGLVDSCPKTTKQNTAGGRAPRRRHSQRCRRRQHHLHKI